MSIHTVKQGEHISRIAADNGFADYRVIWDHPDNARLKEQRKNPNVLFPGDKVVVPDRQDKWEEGSTERRHRFQSKRRGLALKIVLQDTGSKPIRNTSIVLEVEGQSTELKTNGEGLIEREILRGASEGRLRMSAPKADFELKIGSLDPVEERSGQMGRLNNLGYAAGTIEEEDELKFKSAVEEFQCDHQLQVDGACGPQTQTKLKQVHGC